MCWPALVRTLKVERYYVLAFNTVITLCQSRGKKGKTKASHGDLQLFSFSGDDSIPFQ